MFQTFIFFIDFIGKQATGKLKKRIAFFNYKIKIGISFIPMIIFLSGCSQTPQKYRFEGFYMHTVYEVILYDQSEKKAREMADGALAITKALDEKYNALLPGSLIYRLNETGKADLDPETKKIFQDALFYCAESDGKFDITVYPLMKLWGFYVSPTEPGAEPPHHLPTQTEINSVMPEIGYKKIKLESQTISLQKGVKVDLGGILKGYAVDKMSEYLISKGLKAGIVNAGGNLRIIGQKPEGPDWSIGIRHPRKEGDFFEIIKMKDGESIATSGDYEQYFITNNTRYFHIFDAKTGFPVRDHVVSVSVVVPSAEDADAQTKKFFLMGPEKGVKIADDKNLKVLFIMETNGMLYSTNSREWGTAFQ